jgi:hypothetical protein
LIRRAIQIDRHEKLPASRQDTTGFRVPIGHGFSNYTFDDRPRGWDAIAADPGNTSE